MKKITVKKYPIPTKFGEYLVPEVEILVYDDKVTAKSFNIRKHEHALSTESALAAESQAAASFLEENYKAIRVGKQVLTNDQLIGIMLVCDIKAVHFARLLGISKGQMSKLLKDTKLQKTVSIAAIDILFNELRNPGYAKAILGLESYKKPQNAKRADDRFVERVLADEVA